jgi:gamma-glutamyl phosphate reductase
MVMDSKLTLKLDQSVIEKAKHYASKSNTSISKLVEAYLADLVSQEDSIQVTPRVKRLSGIIQLSVKGDSRTSYRKHLLEKYGK